ncbi:MAG TPA: YihY/virulence factor BrkB family protein [Acidobacteriota bacterium]|nr:YihY/virulence factor BrkB family protein [Acidobacteriota bacterium]HMZ80863.1 YihY/virulence factor BrkB family protein [Acidobacteriota bacterium]HNB74106.1 YihY/virulence factor BrkB family protein [Acidobacteriota bacterium]HNG94904.1 YihY/virulence factor BrkB family protein [Acidobacteriota bacterium]
MVPVSQLPHLLWKTIWDMFDKGCVGYAKEAAYSFILSFFPMLLFLTALFAILGRDYMGEILTTLRSVLPPHSHALIQEYIQAFFQNQPSLGILWATAIATLFPAAGLMGTFSKAFDHIYENPNRRSFWADQGISYLMVVIVGAPLLVATIATAAGTSFERMIVGKMGNEHIFSVAWFLGRWAIVFVTVMLIAMLLYHFGPSRTPAWRHIVPGAMLASFLWILLTLGFGAYVSNFGSYTLYGSLAVPIILLVWMYFSALVMLIGAVFNRQCEIHVDCSLSPESRNISNHPEYLRRSMAPEKGLVREASKSPQLRKHQKSKSKSTSPTPNPQPPTPKSKL